MATNEVTVGSTAYRVEPFSGRKANRALRILRDITKEVPQLLELRAKFRADYMKQNQQTLSRAQAFARYGENLAGMKAEDWDASDGVLVIPVPPTVQEEILGIFPDVFDQAEHLVLQLLALAVTSNADVKAWARSGALNDSGRPAAGEDWSVASDGYAPGRLSELGDTLLDGGLDELMELAAVVGETLDSQFRAKADELGDRLGNALRVFGIKWTPKGQKAKDPAEPMTTTVTRTNETPEPTPPSSGATEPAPSASASESESSTSSTERSPTSVGS